MQVVIAHGTNSDSAARVVDAFWEDVSSQSFPGVTVENSQRWWDGNVMGFSFYAKKGFFGSEIEGSVEVTEQAVVVNLDLPGIVAAVVSEADIENTLRDRLSPLLQ